ncbi:uncharacterized protein N7473_005143 [Penicillium subrubescens]|uniref:uncharacterized protein n=1 Tax=Penicillium subrubescens TaxID=1316194 RepID=UPI0025457DAE|nr:uncharacterized protein N7473_005143 [Penicillium subrubescens]KAJ5895744.1 hypothetical protein N7473_005143 [Penicillium subrubescens]
MTQQLEEMANYFGLARAPGAPAAGDIIGYVLWWGRERSDCRSRITAAHHLHCDPCCATSSRMATVTLEFAGELRTGRRDVLFPSFPFNCAAQGIDFCSGEPSDPVEPADPDRLDEAPR